MSDPVSVSVSVAVAASAAAKAASAVVISAAPVAATSPGLLASTGFFLLGAISSWGIIILSVLFLFGIIAEHGGSRGWAVFWALAMSAIAYVVFSVSLLTIVLGSVGYLAIGVVWSFYRYKRHASKIVDKYKGQGVEYRNIAVANLHPKAMLKTITAWIIIWPFSFVEHFVSDIINAIQALVTKIFRGIYHRIYDSAAAALR